MNTQGLCKLVGKRVQLTFLSNFRLFGEITSVMESGVMFKTKTTESYISIWTIKMIREIDYKCPEIDGDDSSDK